MVAYLEMGATEVFDLTIRWPPRYDGPEMSSGPTTYRITGYPPLPFIYASTTAEGGDHRYVALPLCVPAIVTPGQSISRRDCAKWPYHILPIRRGPS